MQQEPSHPLIVSTTLNTEVSQRLQSLLPDIFSHCQIRLTDEGELFLRLYCAVAVRRIREGYPLSECVAEEVDEKVRHAAHEIAELLQQLADKPLSEPEVSWLKVHIAARRYRRLPPAPLMPMMKRRWCTISSILLIPSTTITC